MNDSQNYLKTDYFIRMDADNQDEPKHLIKISKLILNGYELILTERKLRKHSIYMIVLTLLYNKLISLLVQEKLANYSSSLVCFKRKFIIFICTTNKSCFRIKPIIYSSIMKIRSSIRRIRYFRRR